MKLVLWDIDGTLVHTAGYGRDAFGEAFAAVFDRDADLSASSDGRAHRLRHRRRVMATAGVTDGAAHMPRVLDELAARSGGRA